LAAGLSMPQIQALGGGPYQYSITTGAPLTIKNQMDTAPFLQDDWKLKPNLTLSLGLRYEAQTNAGGLRDWAPRVALAWGIGNFRAGDPRGSPGCRLGGRGYASGGGPAVDSDLCGHVVFCYGAISKAAARPPHSIKR